MNEEEKCVVRVRRPSYEPILGSRGAHKASFARKAAVAAVVALVVIAAFVGGYFVLAQHLGSESSAPAQAPPVKEVEDPAPPAKSAWEDALGPSVTIESESPVDENTMSISEVQNCQTSGDVSISVGKDTRKFELYVPDNVKSPASLVFIWHGIASSPSKMEAKIRMKARADAEGFMVAYPYGSGFPASWNGAGCCSDTVIGGGKDDVAFFKAIVTELEGCIDVEKVFSLGFSNGGFMTYRLACEAGLREDNNQPWLRAVGIHSGLMGQNFECNAGPTSVFHIHGTNDDVVGFDGSGVIGQSWQSFVQVMERWLAINSGVLGDSVEVSPSTTCSQSELLSFCQVEGLGHKWSGDPDNANRPDDIDATDAMVQFFKDNGNL